MEATDIKTTLSYAKDDKTRPYLYAYQRSDDERKNTPHHQSDFGGSTSYVETTVRDARSLDMRLDVNSFELVNQTTCLTTDDFYNNQEKIQEVYYAEIAELIQKETGAQHVEIIHHQVRNELRNKGNIQNLNTSVQGYAQGIHSDSHPHSADELFKQYSNMENTKTFKKGRFLYINAWRNISEEPVHNNHLAVCDETSLIKPDDFITCDLYGGSYHIQQYRLSDRMSDQHRWYYFSKMKKDEVLLFKQWDSNRQLSGRICFHTAFSDPNASKDLPPRESIEARAIAYFPDHEPNTCPTLPEEGPDDYPNPDVNEDEETINKSVNKILLAIDGLISWPLKSKVWVQAEFAKGEKGVATIAEALSNDPNGHLGLKSLSKQAKSMVKDELMNQGKLKNRLKLRLDQLKSSTNGTNNSYKSNFLYIMSGASFGYILCMLINGASNYPEL